MLRVAPPLTRAALFASIVTAIAAPAAARADGTFFLLELSTGLSEPVAAGGDFGLSYGVTTGLTWKLAALPFRFHLLGTLAGRNAHASSTLRGLDVSSDRQDVDLYGSFRLGVPIGGSLRIYGEGGVGARWSAETIQREGLSAIEASTSTPIVVGAVGLQFRLAESLSLGLRGELTSVTSGGDVTAAIIGGDYEDTRLSALAQVGFHF